jgi:outer membrane protein OmpA-like peptidoglycan-associated protein
MTSRHRSSLRVALASSLAVTLFAGGVAFAQPVDDPGLDSGKPAPASPPPLTPVPTPTPPPIATTQTVPPANAPTAGAVPGTHESVEETVSFQSGDHKETSVEFYDRLAALSYGGPVGLLHTLTGDVGAPSSLRVSTNFSFFKGSSFLIKGNSTTPGDRDSHFAGDLTISYTPWKYLEAYASLFNSSNQNIRTDTGRTDPQVILALGDLEFGVKGRIPVHKAFDLALRAGVHLLNGVSGISFNGKSTNFTIDAIGTFDVRKVNASVPLRFTANFGFYLDNSLNLLPEGQCGASTGNDACIRSRVVETFAYGIGSDRLRIALAADAPLLLSHVGLQPFLEYHADVALGSGDHVVHQALLNDPNVSSSRLTSRGAQYLTIGARLRPVAGLIFTAAVDIGATSPGFIYGPPTMPWSVNLGLAYAYDGYANAKKTKVITRTITRTTDVPSAPPEGRVRGIVKDAATKKPLSGVIVKYTKTTLTPQVTGEDGTFISYGLLPGPAWMEVSRDDYEAQKVSTDVRAGAESPMEILLTAKPPEAGTVKVHVSDEANQPVQATVRFVSSKGPIVEADPDPAGGYQARLPGGDYSVDVVANGFLSRPHQIQVQAGQVSSVDVQLHKKPKVSHVTLGKGEIILKGVIHFDTNNTEVKVDSQQLLDEVVDIMVANPQIKRVRVEGHTDNKGVPDANLTLSKGRAHSVMAYLVKQGIDPTRLESEGYGASQPLVPNITAANRAKNRRVAFKILE